MNWHVAFKDTNEYVFDDVPLHFENSMQLKTNRHYSDKEITFSINQSANMYVAIDES